MCFDHGVANKRVVSMRPYIEPAAGVVDSGERRRRSCDELGEDGEVGFDGVTEHESVDLEESKFCVLLSEKKHTFSLYRTPKGVQVLRFFLMFHLRLPVLSFPFGLDIEIKMEGF